MREWLNKILLFSIYAGLLGVLFFFVYGTTNQLGAISGVTYKIYWDWELAIPFLPVMIFVYFSLNLLTMWGVFYLNRREIHAIAATYGFAILAAGGVFVAFPTTLGFTRLGHETKYADLFTSLYSVDLPHNLFPSLHVTLASIAVFTIYAKASLMMRKLFLTWLVAILAAVILTHQHHVMDVFGGLILAGISVNLIYFPLAERLKSQQITR